jgi:hypothetical protein
VLEALERVDAHLTAAVVSNDVLFQNKVLAHTVNGTTYCGIRARTTGTYASYTRTYTHLRFTVYDHYNFFSPLNFILSSFSFLLHAKTHIVTHTSVLPICTYTHSYVPLPHTLQPEILQNRTRYFTHSTTHPSTYTHSLTHSPFLSPSYTHTNILPPSLLPSLSRTHSHTLSINTITGAPQNHWFGPAGDPRAAGIGTPEAIKMVRMQWW